MSGRLVILSDTHLGLPKRSVASPEMLRPIWQGATRLILNGDTADVHHPRHRSTAARQMLRLLDLCEADGVAVTVLSGNHDPYLSDVRHLSLAGGSVFVTHGDALHPSIAPWCAGAGRIRRAHDRAWAALDPEARGDLVHRLRVSQHAALAEWTERESTARTSLRRILLQPWMVARVLWYWRVAPDLAARFAADHAPHARYFVFGHSHHPGIWKRGALTVINTGCFGFPGRPRAVVVENGRLLVFPVLRDKGRYVFADQPIARYDLPDAATDETPGPFRSRAALAAAHQPLYDAIAASQAASG